MDRWTTGPRLSKEQVDVLPKVRVSSLAGPCLTYYRLYRKNAKTYTLVFWNGNVPAYKQVAAYKVHTEPCTCCMDHPRTSYPYGYLD